MPTPKAPLDMVNMMPRKASYSPSMYFESSNYGSMSLSIEEIIEFLRPRALDALIALRKGTPAKDVAAETRSNALNAVIALECVTNGDDGRYRLTRKGHDVIDMLINTGQLDPEYTPSFERVESEV